MVKKVSNIESLLKCKVGFDALNGVVLPLNDNEKLILALCYKSAKKSIAFVNLLGLRYGTVMRYLSVLTKIGLLNAVKMKRQGNEKFYYFDPTPDQMKKLPKDMVDYINKKKKEKGGSKK